MSPTREMNEEESKEAREALEEECEHSTYSGKCLLNNEMCYYEEQNLCPDYSSKYVNVRYKNKK